MTFLKFKLRNNLLSSEASIHKKDKRIKHLLWKGNDLKKTGQDFSIDYTIFNALQVYMYGHNKEIIHGRSRENWKISVLLEGL